MLRAANNERVIEAMALAGTIMTLAAVAMLMFWT